MMLFLGLKESPGLLLTGADVCSLGIVGAMMGGVWTAGYALGSLGFLHVMPTARAYSQTMPLAPAPTLSSEVAG